MTTVLICDDHRIVREGCASSWPASRRRPVETAASGEEVLARFPHEQPDLVLMDVRMPGLGGLETTRRLVGSHPDAKVIMLTAADDRDQVAAAVSHGARGYLLKDVSHEELCAPSPTPSPAPTSSSRRCAGARRARDVRTTPPGGQLTERELQVLTGMSQGKSNGQIGRDLYLSEDTIKTHARRLFRKLGVNDRAQAVALGFRRGLVT
jgi:DNA-binding NarL/FixJ family response regulator